MVENGENPEGENVEETTEESTGERKLLKNRYLRKKVYRIKRNMNQKALPIHRNLSHIVRKKLNKYRLLNSSRYQGLNYRGNH